MGPGLLIASPQMRDSNFGGTVVLLCYHDDSGALGLVLNRATRISMADVLRQLELNANAASEVELVLWGGPVEQGAGLLVFEGEVEEGEGWNLPQAMAVSTSREQLESVVNADTPHVLCLGYAGWGPGQLDQEIQDGSWLYTEVDRGLVFDAPFEERYDQALASLGLTSAQVWMTPINE
ncbi:MAG: YqgE/AlgH family protein [Alphaproteobacteria bacterium]|nr:YqgE/AlgH family protein [Alphaproteobacteria bacterium]